MTLPTGCPLCGSNRLAAWNDDEPALCRGCGARIVHYETLTPVQRRRLIREEALDHARTVPVRDGLLW